MCYSLYLSTTANEDLAVLTSSLFIFEPHAVRDDDGIGEGLANPHKWVLTGRHGGCSCHFRHVVQGNEPVFDPPMDEFPEDAEEVESTVAIYELFNRLVTAGHRVDVVDLWDGTPPEYARSIEVSLSQVPAQAFRFFEGYRFVLVP